MAIRTAEDFYRAVIIMWEAQKEIDRHIEERGQLLAMKKETAYAFEIGKCLREIWGQQDVCTSWPQWCREHLPFNVGTANRYLRLYENFKDNPKTLEGLTTAAALKQLARGTEHGRAPGNTDGGGK